MPTDLTVILEDRPGTLAELGEATGRAGVNIEGVCGFPCEGQGVIHVLVEDARRGREALEQAGLRVAGERDVIVTPVEDRPGEFGAILRRIADAGVNVDLAYLATGTRLVIGANDLERVRGLIG